MILRYLIPCILAGALSVFAPPRAAAQTLLNQAPAYNARVVRLEHATRPEDRARMLTAVQVPQGGVHVEFYAAPRPGVPFQRTGALISDPAFAGGLCYGTLYEVPRTIGRLPEGTLLWTASVGQKAPSRRMTIRIYESGDEGHSWNFLSEIESPNHGGLWEPEFTVDRSGALVLFFSDETDQPEFSQTLKKVRSVDGLHWSQPAFVVASRDRRDRPGMAVTGRLRDGRWIMTYELCGPAQCIARYRLSPDGWNWGDPADVGNEIRLANGAFPAHAPRFTVMPDGAIVLAGQLLERPDLELGPRNGKILLANLQGQPASPWTGIPAPVPVPEACSKTCQVHQWCPNYSSALLPSVDGQQLLEFASRWSNRGCITSYAWSPWAPHAAGYGR